MPTGLILQPTYQICDERPVVRLFGRLLDGPPFLVEDDGFRPYLFVKARDSAMASSRAARTRSGAATATPTRRARS